MIFTFFFTDTSFYEWKVDEKKIKYKTVRESGLKVTVSVDKLLSVIFNSTLKNENELAHCKC